MDEYMTCQIFHTPTVVLMAGLPGAGKTTLAHALGQDLHWPILDKDKLKLAFLKTGMTDIQAGMLAYEAVFTLMHDLLVRQQLSVIIDSATLHLFILEHVTEIAYTAQAQLKIILCTIESDIRAQRLNQRTTDLAQHVAEPDRK